MQKVKQGWYCVFFVVKKKPNAVSPGSPAKAEMPRPFIFLTQAAQYIISCCISVPQM